MLDRMLLADVLDEALKKGGEFAEIYIEEKVSTSVFCEEDRIEKINSGRKKSWHPRPGRKGVLPMFIPMI